MAGLTLKALIESAAHNDPKHPNHARLMDAVSAWTRRTFDEDAPPASMLPRLAASGAMTNPKHPKHGELQHVLDGFVKSLPWAAAPGALDPAPDPDTADVRELLTSFAVRDTSHPLHAATRARIDAHYATLPGGDAPVL